MMMDTFFISHGSPKLIADENIAAKEFFESWRKEVLPGVIPKAVLMVSAHWDTSVPAVNIVDGPNATIHDFSGFPEYMYQLKYSAPGAPNLARRVKELLHRAGFDRVEEDEARGLDHGAWLPLMLMYPEADIPVCQLSVQSGLDGTHHYNMGKALAPLREEGVLLIGSGAATHNLGARGSVGGPVVDWAFEFDTWLKDSLLDGRNDDVNHYEERAPYAKMAHPWPEHFFPLHVALGAAGDNTKAELIHHSWGKASLSYASYRFSVVH